MPAERARAIVELSVAGQSNVDRAMQSVVNRSNQLKQANQGLERSVERHRRTIGELRTNLQGIAVASKRRENSIRRETDALRTQADVHRQAIRQAQTDRSAARLIKGARDRRAEQRRLQRELVKERRALDEVNAAIARNGRRARQEGADRRRIQSRLNDLIVEEKRRLDDVNRSMQRNRRELRRQEHEARRLRTEATMGVNTMSQLALVSGNLLIGVGGALSAGLYVASRGILSYNTVLNETAAVSGASAEEIRLLDRQARQLGLTTEKSASEAAAGQRELGRAGFQVNETLAATPGVLALSTIGNIEMGRSAEYLAGTLRQFELEAKMSGRVVDVFAQAVTSSLFNVEGLGVALGTAGPLANQFNIPLERTVALLSTVRSAGVGPARTGTGLRSFLAAVANMSEGDVRKLSEVGVSAQQLQDLLMQGEISGIGRLLENVDARILTNVFGTEASNVTAIIAAQHQEIDRMEQTLLNAEGAAASMRDVMNRGVVGAFREARSAADSLVLSLGDSGLTGGLTVSADVAKTGLRFFDRLPGPFKTLAAYLVIAGPLIVGAGVGLRVFAAATAHATVEQIKMNAATTANNLGLARLKMTARGAATSLGALRLGALTGGVLGLGAGLGVLTWHLNNVRESATGAFDAASAAVQRNIDALSQVSAVSQVTQEQVKEQQAEATDRVRDVEQQRQQRIAEIEREAQGILGHIQAAPAALVNAYAEAPGDLADTIADTARQAFGFLPFVDRPLTARDAARILAQGGEVRVPADFTPSAPPIAGVRRPGLFDSLANLIFGSGDPNEIYQAELAARRQLADIDREAVRQSEFLGTLPERRADIERQIPFGYDDADPAGSGGAIAFQRPFADEFFGFGEDIGGGRILLQFVVDSTSREGQDLLRIADSVAGGLGE